MGTTKAAEAKKIFNQLCLGSGLFLLIYVGLCIVDSDFAPYGIAFSWIPSFLTIRKLINNQDSQTTNPLTWRKVGLIMVKPSKVFEAR